MIWCLLFAGHRPSMHCKPLESLTHGPRLHQRHSSLELSRSTPGSLELPKNACVNSLVIRKYSRDDSVGSLARCDLGVLRKHST